MPQLVRHQDRQQRQRKRQPGQEQLRTAQPDREDIEIAFEIEERQVVAEVVLHVRADQRGREQRRDEQQQMQPQAVFRAA